MTAYADAFKAEIARAVRRELKAELEPLRKTIANQRRDIATLKRDLKAVTVQLSKLLKSQNVIGESEQMDGLGSAANKALEKSRRGGRRFVFRSEVLVAKRKSFGVSQREMASLLGVSLSSESNWETGKSVPRAAQIEQIREILAIGKREALARISQ